MAAVLRTCGRPTLQRQQQPHERTSCASEAKKLVCKSNADENVNRTVWKHEILFISVRRHFSMAMEMVGVVVYIEAKNKKK